MYKTSDFIGVSAEPVIKNFGKLLRLHGERQFYSQHFGKSLTLVFRGTLPGEIGRHDFNMLTIMGNAPGTGTQTADKGWINLQLMGKHPV